MRLFVLINDQVRLRALDAIRQAPDGYEVTVSPQRISRGQQARFHAMCGDIASSGIEWAGRPRTPTEWKVLLVSAHATATRQDVEVVRGIEGEMINIRESLATMDRGRAASLIEYATAFAVSHGVRLRD
jgi:hypothetical protein